MTSFIESSDDMAWLVEVHKAPAGYAVAILYGNENSPTKIELFARNHHECIPTVMVSDENGELQVISVGEQPKDDNHDDTQRE